MKLIKKVFFLTLNTLIIFTPAFRIFPKWTWIVAGLGVLCLFDDANVKKIGFTSKSILVIIILAVINTVRSIYIPLVYKTNDFTYTALLLGLILCILRAVFLSYVYIKLFRSNATIENYISYFINSCLVYFGFTLSFIISPAFKKIWMSRIIYPVEGSDYFAYKYRYGLDGFAAFSTASIFSICILLCAYLLMESNISRKEFNKRLIIYIIICAGSFFYGRVCIFAIIVSMFYILYLCKPKVRLLKTFLYVSIIMGIAFSVLTSLAGSNQEIKIWVDWAFEIIFKLFNGNVMDSYSVSHMLEDMYFIPSLKTLLFGDGRYQAITGTGYYMNTDVGFIRPVLFFGIIGVIINYSMLIILLRSMMQNYKILGEKSGRLLMLGLLLIAMILELKGEAFHRVIYCTLPVYFIQYYTLKSKECTEFICNKEAISESGMS